MRAFLAELATMIDGPRRIAVVTIVAGGIVVALLLAANPGLEIGDGGWIILVGLAVSSAFQVFEGRRAAGRPAPGAWGLAAGAAVLLAFGAVWGLAWLLRPAVESTGALSGNPVVLAVVAWLLLAIGAVLWQRAPQRRAVVAALALSIGLILAGVAALRNGSVWAPIPIVALLMGLGVFVVAAGAGLQQRASERAANALATAAGATAPGSGPTAAPPSTDRRQPGDPPQGAARPPASPPASVKSRRRRSGTR